MKNKIPLLKLLIGAGLALGLIYFGLRYDVHTTFQGSLERIRDLGSIGPLVFGSIYVIAVVALLPGLVFTMGAGAIYGIFTGTLVALVSATLGATAAFLVGRYLAREWVANRIENNQRFKAIDKGVAKEGWKIVGLTRLSPFFPFNLLNYAFGITRVSLRDYVLASFFGMLPGTLMYVYVGSLAGNLSALGSNTQGKFTSEFVLYAVGLVATILVSLYITRIARAALKQRIQ